MLKLHSNSCLKRLSEENKEDNFLNFIINIEAKILNKKEGSLKEKQDKFFQLIKRQLNVKDINLNKAKTLFSIINSTDKFTQFYADKLDEDQKIKVCDIIIGEDIDKNEVSYNAPFILSIIDKID
tara:strand:- start:1002 stop:1376 length:375 start_codon:yes stop_codon:yes gene_type:complete